jgi:phosphate/sulfate permease
MDIYLIIVVVLLALAISDLIVGVSNDAVNFLNSAIGSKVAPMKVIMLVASLGVLIGASFSSGMMEVARKGIFHPEQFYFSEIMVIFLAVMVTDIILLDAFNTMGMPTSTTVSIVFELLGSAVAVSVIKIYQTPDETLLNIGKYINSEKALAIIFGILLSVIVAFIFGAVIQYISRIIFSFKYNKTLKYFGSIWGGMAITVITYFMLIKGVKGASFITPETSDWIKSHSTTIITYSFVAWTIILQLLYWLFRVSIPKVIILVGTFALAMAFAGNDLVNFIGVPLAGLQSYQDIISTPGATPDSYLMTSLTLPVKTNTYLLLIAGAIMIITLWFSKKARSVIATTIDLSRQGHGEERFGTSVLSRTIVRSSHKANKAISSVIPSPVRQFIDSRFQVPKKEKKNSSEEAAVSFDLIRASVNLVVASILIAFGTSLKLPLSTTYVTFMVAMGTSLADRAWGRDDAVYRIQGVFSVIGGWFLTAIVAFIVSFIIANIIYWGGIIAIVIILGFVLYLIYRTHILHKNREAEKLEDQDTEFTEEILSASVVLKKCQNHAVKILLQVPGFYENLVKGLKNEDRQLLKELTKDVKKFNKKVKKIKDNVNDMVIKLKADQIDTGAFYVQSVDYMREIAHCVTYMAVPSFEHIENNHDGIEEEQAKELRELATGIRELFGIIVDTIRSGNYDNLETIIGKQQKLLDQINKIRKNQLKRIKAHELQTRRSLLFLDLLAETKNLLLYSINLLKSQRDFILEINKTNQE